MGCFKNFRYVWTTHYFTCKCFSPVCLCRRSVCNGLLYRTIARSLVPCDNVLCICIHLQQKFSRFFVAVKLELYLTCCNGARWTSGRTVMEIPLPHVDITWPATYKRHCRTLCHISTRFTCFGYVCVVEMTPVEQLSILREHWCPCYARSHSRKKYLLASACLSVCLSVCPRLSLDGFLWNLKLGTPKKIRCVTSDLVKFGPNATGDTNLVKFGPNVTSVTNSP